jgi:hypothetical protein
MKTNLGKLDMAMNFENSEIQARGKKYFYLI